MARARTRERDDVAPKPRSDAYVGLLVISLIAMITGCVFLYLDLSQYPETKAPKVQDRPPAPAPPK
jgi:hypothetical protein